MESVGEIPADALPAGWSAGGVGARDPEAAQRQAQQVRALVTCTSAGYMRAVVLWLSCTKAVELRTLLLTF